jgi:hypothetical protein
MRMPQFTADAALGRSRHHYAARRTGATRTGIHPALGEGCGSYCERNGEHCCCLPGERCVEYGSHCWCEDSHPVVLKPEPVWR